MNYTSIQCHNGVVSSKSTRQRIQNIKLQYQTRALLLQIYYTAQNILVSTFTLLSQTAFVKFCQFFKKFTKNNYVDKHMEFSVLAKTIQGLNFNIVNGARISPLQQKWSLEILIQNDQPCSERSPLPTIHIMIFLKFILFFYYKVP